ncbi:MAG: hypothetical protein CMM53_10840 [Rhodospirillaceae bacterium]|nr:hypothetical protein [Rhodospirillaceae bacterium]
MIVSARRKFPAIVFITIIGFTSNLAIGQIDEKKNIPQQPLLLAAEKYLNSIRSLQAYFVQSSTTGAVSDGTLFIARPGKLRIQYKTPITLQVYANDTWLYYIDYDLREISQIPVDKTPASFLLRNKFRFSRELDILNTIKSHGTLRIEIAMRESAGGGSMTLIFSENIDAFLGWVVKDTQGIKTKISLMNTKINLPIPKELFIFSIPDWAFPADPQD